MDALGGGVAVRTPEKSVSPAPRCVCSSTGGSFPQLRTPSSGLAGSGAAPPSGTRATAGPRRDASASRRSTSSGDPTGTCPSAGLCPACPACSSTATPEPHPPDGKAPATYAGHREDHRAGRTDPGPLCRQRHHGAGRCAGGLLRHRHRSHGRLCRTGQRPASARRWRTSNDTPLLFQPWTARTSNDTPCH